MARSRTQAKGAGDYAREAFSEWGKAARYGARAAASATAALAQRRRGRNDRPPLRERLNPATTEKGGKLGDVADIALSKFGGAGGKLASKLSAGSRIVERVRSSGEGHGSSTGTNEDSGDDSGGVEAVSSNGNGFRGDAPIPIQESIEVAVPVRAVYALCTRFEEYPEFLDHVKSAELIDDSDVLFAAKVRGRERELEVEVVDERPNERLDWRCAEGVEHSGVASFHELAPRLTHIELTVELEPEGIVERLTRSAHLSQRAIRAEMHRFKAYAELHEAELVDETADEPDDEEELEDEDEELVDEEEFDDEDELEDEEEPDDEEEFEDEELEDEERLDPARPWR